MAMTLGQKIRSARIERSLTQKQLVGDQITRNMLSKIENDSATPSVKTLEFLASRLGLPAGYFLEGTDTKDSTVDTIPDGLSEMRRAYREGRYKDCMELLENDRDACATDEGFLLRTKSALASAKEALAAYDYAAAKEYADDADYYNKQGIYYSADIDAEMSLVLAECALALDISDFERNAAEFSVAAAKIDYSGRFALAQAEYLLRTDETELASRALAAMSRTESANSAEYIYMYGECTRRRGDGDTALEYLQRAESAAAGNRRLLKMIYYSLERLYNEREDFKQAYKYASLQLRDE